MEKKNREPHWARASAWDVVNRKQELLEGSFWVLQSDELARFSTLMGVYLYPS